MSHSKNPQRACRFLMLVATVVVSVVTFTGTLRAGDSEGVLALKAMAETAKAVVDHKRAEAEIIKSTATAYKTLADIRKVRAECHALELNNQLLRAKVFYEKRTMRNEHVSSRRPVRTTTPETQKVAAVTRVQITPVHVSKACWGDVAWPGILQHELFTAERREIQEVMMLRLAASSSANQPCYMQVRNAVNRLNGKLRKNINQFTGSESIAARKFLQAVLAQAQSPVDDDDDALLAAK